ncbi:MAG TPA: glucoamylase family protein [Pirellulales bacterium]
MRAELLSTEQLEQHAKTVAASHEVDARPGPDRLLGRLQENEAVLNEGYRRVVSAVAAKRRTSPADEWLLDNYYLVEDQIRIARRHLPKDYSTELPRLTVGPLAGFPRVYDLMQELISHVDGRVTSESLVSLVAAYQTVNPLTLGELWAIPIMLRLALVENLRRVVARMTAARLYRDEANAWADRMNIAAEADPAGIVVVMADMTRAAPAMDSEFVAELARRLQERSHAMALPLLWLEERLAERNVTIDQLMQSEGQQQAADQVSIGNSVSSLRFLGAVDWRAFVELLSIVEQILRGYPLEAFGDSSDDAAYYRRIIQDLQSYSDVYEEMDFATRDQYRHAVEQVAKSSGLPEWQVALKASRLAQRCADERGVHDRSAHVGYFLIDRGLPILEKETYARRTLRQMISRFGRRYPLPLYLGAIATITATFSACALAYAYGNGASGLLLLTTAVLVLLGTSQLGVAVVNWLATLWTAPRTLPRMDFSEGVPADSRTLVAIPTMLTSPDGVHDLIESLEVRYLANRDERIHFALLTDLKDAPTETLPEDQALIDQARQEIEALNNKYKGDRSDIFFLFHRPRRWNSQERTWMGYERKRGKLGDLNAFLRGNDNSRFTVVVGDTASIGEVRYVITLDSDTQLPREAARRLIATMAHPLNRPCVDSSSGLISDGYCILQPRVSLSLASARRSWLVRIFGGQAGIDPYTGSVSDVYQDLFHEGSFIGKGIYDVDAFERFLGGRFPDNLILSHDLLEGCHARSGLVSDIELFETYPAHYGVDVSRRHRWIRGDWQILMWALPWVPKPQGGLVANPLSALSRWKILDNLRRSFVPISLVLLLSLYWLVPLGTAAFWTFFVALILLTPVLLRIFVEFLKKPTDLSWPLHARDTLRSLGLRMIQALCALTFLPDEAYYSSDAVVRTVTRLFITKRNLLQWRTSSDVERSARPHLFGLLVAMWFGPVLAGLLAGYLMRYRPGAMAAAAPVLVLWIVSPVVAWWLSRPLPSTTGRLTADDERFLAELSRKTWRFFETFVSAEDNWLPPDNFQDYPAAVIAHRTSPTNIGLALLSNLTAYDFGFIAPQEMAERTTNTFATLRRLERYEGHFFNWYDTRTLAPLLPRYVSTVDSGNLVGHLLVLREGLLQIADHDVLPLGAMHGLGATLRVLVKAIRSSSGSTSHEAGVLSRDSDRACRELGTLEAQLLNAPPNFSARMTLLRGIDECADLAELEKHPDEEVRWWSGALRRQVRSWLDDVSWLAPLASLLHPKQPSSDGALGSSFSNALQAAISPDAGPFTWRRVAALEEELAKLLTDTSVSTQNDHEKLAELKRLVGEISREAKLRMDTCEQLAEACLDLSTADFEFLYDSSRKLLAIGFNVTEYRRDASFYDLLASEARLASYVAIAQGQLPQEHWFALGRLLTGVNGEPTLLSWSGSMFEYLMPLLVMPTFADSLLDQTYKGAVARQITYGNSRHVLWGISESGYNATDAQLNYQYRAFGVPGLGFKRGLADDLVIAPYASAMALMVDPNASCANLRRLAELGIEGRYGFYEALDYTTARVGRGQPYSVVRSFMAHHQGMSFLAFAYELLKRPMQRRFESYAPFQATELLLHERVPKTIPVFPRSAENDDASRPEVVRDVLMRVLNTPNTQAPEVHLLSNGRYHVMITNAGSGYSRWRDIAITRWREDIAQDDSGTFCYLRDVTSNEVWSVTYQPTLESATSYKAIFPQSRAEFRRRDFDLDTYTEVAVSPEDDVELRRVNISNRSRHPRTIELTTYAEVVLASAESDATHPAFSNLFVQTEIVRERDAILCTRRPRSHSEHPPWMLHLMSVHGRTVGSTSFETDKAKFLGRAHNVRNPQVMTRAAPLSNSEGPVLDPIVAIRATLTIEPGETAVVDIVSGAAETRDVAIGLIEKYHDRHLADRLIDLAWTHSQVVLQQLNASEAEAQLYGRLASAVIYASSTRRANVNILAKNTRGQSGLWGHGISGDLPIILLRLSDQKKIHFVEQLVRAHAYWRFKGLVVDLVIWNEDQSGYRQELHDEIMHIIGNSTEANLVDRPGGIFVRRPELMSEEDRILLETAARIVLTDTAGTLSDQIERRGSREPTMPSLISTRVRTNAADSQPRLPHRDLIYANGLGGFTPDGREYVITTSAAQRTPAPWSNVLANAEFGTVVTESGSGYTWFENAHEFRLTPWYNDPVTDRCGEALYLRDEDSGRFWSATPLPAPGNNSYVTRHGFGYSVFETIEDGVSSELTLFVALDAPVKFYSLKLRNTSQETRRLSATCCIEWILGDLRHKSLMHVVTEIDKGTSALLARNSYNSEFPGRVAYLDISEPARSYTGDRTEFIGRNGSYANPAAMSRDRLSGKLGAGLDPCGVLQTQFVLAAGEEREIVFRLGAAANIDDARTQIQRFRGVDPAHKALQAVWQYWQRTLGAVYVETPDPGINALTNGWLLYQTLACRFWGRSGYYQSGGAFGFRDQLQDVMALVHTEPRLIREHLLRAAAHQFPQGDVQHWWHPPTGRGVRTHFSDDFLWLPLATCRYVKQIGDTGVLDERIPYIEGRALKPEEEAYYDLPSHSDQSATLYEHCVRAIENGLRFGRHGLPLMGCGDWNDGMNLVGEKGQGESVWLAFFLVNVLKEFADIARQRADQTFAEKCEAQAVELTKHIEANAWDGQWYRRAYFDNGEPLGSATNLECQIDSIPQSWAVLSGAGDLARCRQAMAAVNDRLVRRDASLIQLFQPPFDKSPLDPGYIRGYLPGVRENGGQYTHAAIWTVMAFAALGDRNRAWELLSLINPVNHGSTPPGIATYKVEPYVIAADVYAVTPHVGRGGWTWYTGSAGWMYRLITESLLGLRLDVNKLYFAPCLPAGWPSIKVYYRFHETNFEITIWNGGSGIVVDRVILDGIEQPELFLPLVDDGITHKVEIRVS